MNRGGRSGAPAKSYGAQPPQNRRIKAQTKLKPACKLFEDAVSDLSPIQSMIEPKKSALGSPTDGGDATFPLIDGYSTICVGTYNNDEKDLSKCRRDEVQRISKSMHFPGVPLLYTKPSLPIRLEMTKESYRNGDPSVTHLIIAARRCNIDLAQFNFVTERYNLNRIGNGDLSWSMGAQKVGNSIFLISLSDQVVSNPGALGFKFEASCTVASTLGTPKGSFLRLMSSRIGGFSLLLLCETDAIEPDDIAKVPSEQRCVEIKSCKDIDGQKRSQWWLQSFLGGVQKVAVGFKDAKSTLNSCRIERIEEFETQSLLKSKQVGESSLNLINAALKFLVENVEEGKVYLFRRGKFNQDTHSRDWQLFALPDGKFNFITPKIISQVATLPNTTI